ncbi:MAG: hypothetical protein COV48_04040 [Elusimicrobia bacterium CG11_big_fil_rev_8_21_14_0_20_64_6]|nr:MAG: hypothetical protein COV48_04040 [Elusimicrobia bacterium CG11_big_fil_rev_8_21_14_0_20_64_6]
MVNRTALAALLLALTSPSWAGNVAIQDARAIAGGHSLGVYDGGCSAGSCGDPTNAINQTSANALRTGGLAVAKASSPLPSLVAEVPAPELSADEKGAKDKPGFFKKLFSGKGLMHTLGSAAVGAGIGWLVGGPAGALIGGLIGAVAGFFMSRMLAK